METISHRLNDLVNAGVHIISVPGSLDSTFAEVRGVLPFKYDGYDQKQ